MEELVLNTASKVDPVVHLLELLQEVAASDESLLGENQQVGPVKRKAKVVVIGVHKGLLQLDGHLLEVVLCRLHTEGGKLQKWTAVQQHWWCH